MLKEEKLDVFLDAFLDGKKPAQETDLDFWDEKSEPEKNDFWEAQDVLTAPKHKGKLSKRTIASMFLILILIPVTIWIGITLFDDRKYFVISLAIAVYCMLPFFLIFEDRRQENCLQLRFWMQLQLQVVQHFLWCQALNRLWL